MLLIKYFKFAFFPLDYFNFQIEPIIIAGGIAAGASLASSGLTNYLNYKATKEANEDNLDFQKLQFLEQQTLNRKGYQIQVADMQKAGLNPATLNGGNLSAGSYSSTSEAPQVSDSGFQSLLQTMVSAKTQEEITKMNNDTAKDINNANIASNEKIEADKLSQQKQQYDIINAKDERRLQIEEAKVDLEKANLKASEKKILEDIVYTRAQSDTAIRALFERVKTGLPEAALSSNVGAAAAVAKAVWLAALKNDYESFRKEYEKLVDVNEY